MKGGLKYKMSNYNSHLQSNNIDLQVILDAINELPDASSGVELPLLTKEGSASDLLAGKELIDSDGNIITGSMPNNGDLTQTFDGVDTKSVTIPAGYTSGGSIGLDNTIDNEVDTQASLISLIRDTANSLPNANGSSSDPILQNKTVTPTTNTQIVNADSGYDGLDTVTVNAIPSNYIIPEATKDAETYTPNTVDQTIASGTYLTGVQTIKGDANLVPANIVSGKTIFGVAGTATAGGSGDTAENYEDELLDGTLVDYTNTTVTKLKGFAFCQNTALQTVNLPSCSTIGISAFSGCSALTTASFEKCVSITSAAFYGCTKLKNISFPACTSIYYRAFTNCTSLVTLNFPVCTYIGGYAFQGCSRITSLDMPRVRTIYSSTFQSCSALTTASFPALTTIGSTAFGKCSKLVSFYLAGSTVCGLSNSNAFSGTGITSTSGAIYVNASLVDAYKSATNWTYFSDRIFAITE